MAAFRVRTVFTGVAGSPWVSNLYWDESFAATAEDAHDATVDFWAALRSVITQAASYTVEAEVVRYLTPDTIVSFHAVTPVSNTCTAAGDMLPSQNQGLISWASSQIHNNRRITGRTFIPGPVESSSSNMGRPEGAYMTALGNAVSAISGRGLVIPSRAANAFANVTVAQPRGYWAVLRSRRD